MGAVGLPRNRQTGCRLPTAGLWFHRYICREKVVAMLGCLLPHAGRGRMVGVDVAVRSVLKYRSLLSVRQVYKGVARETILRSSPASVAMSAEERKETMTRHDRDTLCFRLVCEVINPKTKTLSSVCHSVLWVDNAKEYSEPRFTWRSSSTLEVLCHLGGKVTLDPNGMPRHYFLEDLLKILEHHGWVLISGGLLK